MLQSKVKPVTDWAKRNLRTVSTHLTVPQAKELQAICRRHGTKPYRLLKDYLLEVIQEDRITRYVGSARSDTATSCDSEPRGAPAPVPRRSVSPGAGPG